MLQRNTNSATSAETYRPDIDGLRAVAVLAVLANHYGADWLPGGFTGVDVFFVISGYLITQGLVSDIPKGGNWLLRFYERRARRLLPALAVVLLFSFAAGLVLLTPGDFAALGSSAVYSSFGFGNVYFFQNTGYFDREAELQPLLHLWSLGVEEQFYFLWPIMLAGLLSLGGTKRIKVALTLGILCSLIFAHIQIAYDPTGAFYLPFSRAWELAVGAALVFIPQIRGKTLSAGAIGIGLVLILASYVLVRSELSFPGLAAAPAVLGAAAIVARKERVSLDLLLANRLMVGVGLISYSLYLWHWPLLVFFRTYMDSAELQTVHSLGLAVLSFCFAYLTWRYVEPIRNVRMKRSSALAAALICCISLSLIGKSIDWSQGFIQRFPPIAPAIASLDEMWRWDGCREEQVIDEFNRSTCTFGADWNTATSRGVVWGDSHAQHYAPLIEAVMPPGHAAVLVGPCPAALGVHVFRERPGVPGFPATCATMQEKMIEFINQGDIDWVVLAGSWGPLSGVVEQDGSLPDLLNGPELLAAGLSQMLSRLRAAPLVTIVGQSPSGQVEPTSCALGLWRWKCADQAALAAKSTDMQSTPTNTELSKLAAASRVQFIPTSTKLCDEEKCDIWFEGEPLYRDTNHLRRNFPNPVKRKLAERLDLSAVFPSSP